MLTMNHFGRLQAYVHEAKDVFHFRPEDVMLLGKFSDQKA